MRRFLDRIAKFWRQADKRQMASKTDVENEDFLRVAQEQLRELAKKGLSIPVFTL